MRTTSFGGSRRFGGNNRRSSFSGPRTTGRSNAYGTRHRSQVIDPAKFVSKAVMARVETTFEPTHQFADFKLSERILKNVLAHGYTTPTPIQDGAIIPISEGRDLIGLANTGTGKTASFLLPLMNRLQNSNVSEAVLIIVPTRELAGQIAEEFRAFAHGIAVTATVCVGGAPIKRQISNLQKRPQVIIGTPGRLKDLAMQRKLDLSRIQTLVLDEADQMLDMGFIKDIKFIINLLPTKRQSLCFSATLSPDIAQLVNDMLHDPVTVSVRTGTTSENVEQNVLLADTPVQKLDILVDLLKKPDFDKVLIFGKTKHGVQRLADTLSTHDLTVEAIHGNKSQAQRQRALQAFKANKVQVLVATDVAARGLDIPNVSHVINFDQPTTYQDYVHRIGRTGRAGNLGKALTFVPTNSRV